MSVSLALLLLFRNCSSICCLIFFLLVKLDLKIQMMMLELLQLIPWCPVLQPLFLSMMEHYIQLSCYSGIFCLIWMTWVHQLAGTCAFFFVSVSIFSIDDNLQCEIHYLELASADNWSVHNALMISCSIKFSMFVMFWLIFNAYAYCYTKKKLIFMQRQQHKWFNIPRKFDTSEN